MKERFTTSNSVSMSDSKKAVINYPSYSMNPIECSISLYLSIELAKAFPFQLVIVAPYFHTEYRLRSAT